MATPITELILKVESEMLANKPETSKTVRRKLEKINLLKKVTTYTVFFYYLFWYFTFKGGTVPI